MMIDSRCPDNVRQILHDCMYAEDGLEVFCRFFLNNGKGKRGGTFSKAWSPQRREFSQLISDPSIPFLSVEAFRGFAKSTLLKAEVIRRICLRLTSFVVYTSAELKLAERQTDAIRFQLINTPRIKQFFGDMRPTYFEGAREAFGTKSYKLVDPLTNESICSVVPKSEGTAVNGLLDFIDGREQRPNLLISDDGMDRKRRYSEEYRDEHFQWYIGTFLPCTDDDQPDPITHKWEGIQRGDTPPYSAMVIDTFKHPDGTHERLEDAEDWVTRRYPKAIKTDKHRFKSAIPEQFTDEQVQAQYDGYRNKFMTALFWEEFMCASEPDREGAFPEKFQYYEEDRSAFNADDNLYRFIIMDPARSKNKRSCPTGILGVAVDPRNAKIYLRKIVNERMDSKEIVKTLFEMMHDLNTCVVGVEDDGLNDWIRGALSDYAELHGAYLQPIWLKSHIAAAANRGDFSGESAKAWRAQTAIPYYQPSDSHEMGHVWHEESVGGSALEGQMHSYPNCKFWDSMDCLGYLQQMMDTIGIQFEMQCAKGSGEYKARAKDEEDWDNVVKLWSRRVAV